MANKSDDGRAEQSTEQRTQAWHHRPVPVPVPVPVPIVVPVAVTVPVSVAVPASDGGQFGGPNRRHCTPPSLFPPTRSQFDPHAVRQTGKYGGIGASGHRGIGGAFVWFASPSTDTDTDTDTNRDSVAFAIVGILLL